MENKNYQRILLMRMHSNQLGEVKHPHHIYPPLLLKYMETLLKQEGYEVKLIDAWLPLPEQKNILETVTEWGPDVAVLMANPIDSRAAFGLGHNLKKHHECFLVAVGQEVGLHLGRFSTPDCPFDVALSGESEVELLSLINRLNAKGADATRKKYAVSHDLKPFVVHDLNKLPFPTYEPEEVERYCFSAYPLRMKKHARWGFLLSSRGCPYECYFCSPVMRKTYGTKVRLRTAENVVDEIEHLMGLGINVISFEDDDLTAKRSHVLGICREIRQRQLDIHWICHARVDELDGELMQAMKDAGCILLRIGVESASDRILQLLRKNPKKKDWKPLCQSVFREARKLGIATNALVIIGNPDETREEAEATINFVCSLNPDMVQVHFFTLYPGSPAYEEHKGRVPEDQIAKMHHYNLPLVNMSQLTDEELWELRGAFYKRFFLRPVFVMQHLYHYSLFYLTNPKVFRQLSNVAGIL